MRTPQDIFDAVLATGLSSAFYGLPLVLMLFGSPSDLMDAKIEKQPERVAEMIWDISGMDLPESETPDPTGSADIHSDAEDSEEEEQLNEDAPEPTDEEEALADAPAAPQNDAPAPSTPAEATTAAAPLQASLAPTSSRVDAHRAARYAAAKAPTTARSGNPNGRPGRCDVDHPEIEQLSETHWTIDRSMVDYYTSSVENFNSLGWSGSYDKNGIEGWEVGGFGCRSPLYEGGLRARDVVLSVDRIEVTSRARLFRAWKKVRNDDQVVVKVVRRGQPMTFTYTLI